MSLIIKLFLLLALCISCSQSKYNRLPANLGIDNEVKSKIQKNINEGSYKYCTPDNLNYIQSNNNKIVNYLNGIDGQSDLHMNNFLKNLPKGIFQSAVSLIDSNSMQGANFHNPRFVLLGRPSSNGQNGENLKINAAGSVMSINMDKNERGYKNIEFMLWSDKNKHFNFIDVEFNDNLKHPKVTVNPAKCTACHTPYRKPNWESYNFWPNQVPTTGDSYNYKIEKDAVENLTNKIENPADFRWSYIKSIDPKSIFFTKKYSPEILHDGQVIKFNGGSLHDDLQSLNRCRRENIIFNKDQNKEIIQKLVGYLNYCLKNEYQELSVSWKPSDFLELNIVAKHNDFFKKLLKQKNVKIPEDILAQLVKLNIDGMRRRIEVFKKILKDNGYDYNTTIDKLINYQDEFGGPKFVYGIEVPSELTSNGGAPEGSIIESIKEFSYLWYVLGPLGVNLNHWSLSIVPQEMTFGDNVIVSNAILNKIAPYENGFCSNPLSFIKREFEKNDIEALYNKNLQKRNESFNLPNFSEFVETNSNNEYVKKFIQTGENAYKVQMLYLKWSEMDIKTALEYEVF